MTNIKETVTEIQRNFAWFRENEEKANHLRQQIPQHAQRFFGLIGARYEGGDFEIIPNYITFRKVTNPPGVVHVCRAADASKTDYLGVSRYSSNIAAEIAIGNSELKRDSMMFNMAWDIVVLLKLRGHTLLTAPASTTISWDTVAAENDQAIQFNLHDDVSRQIALKPKKEITHQDLEWVKENLENAIELQDASTSQRFSLGFNLAHSWNHTHDGRIAIANIWSGLEALFGIQNDRPVTKKLAERIHAWLPIAMTLDEIIELYNHRCDAVHGRKLKAQEFTIAIKSSFSLLQKSLVKCIETKQKTLPDWSGS